jgi:D-sedoheptulose 7-phosphate isomerase
MRIAIDYDGTIAKYIKGDWGIHPLLEGAKNKILDWIDEGHHIVVYTARHNGECGQAVEEGTRSFLYGNIGAISIHFGKPGDADIFIDDTPTKMIRVDTNIGLAQVQDDWLMVVPYFEKLRDALAKLPVSQIGRAIDMLAECRYDSLGIAICGNGGSMATAQHFVCDLQKIGFMATALDSQATMTMWANDTDFELVFRKQLELVCPDVVVVISGSGNSPNILEAIDWADETGRYVIALLGDMGYSQAKELVDIAIVVPSDDYQIIEDCHLAICHYMVTRLRNDNFQNSIKD